MSRLLMRAVLVATVTALALSQFQREPELLVWEALLLIVVIMEMRAIPTAPPTETALLFHISEKKAARLPKGVASTELMVVDATGGYLSPERRLQPVLTRIAAHRLERRGISSTASEASAALGEGEWAWLVTPATEPVDPGLLERVVAGLEEL